MRKFISVCICIMMCIAMIAVSGCAGSKDENVKLGFGVHIDVTKASDANEDVNGQGGVVITAAAVTLDKNGKIVACAIDVADIEVSYTSAGLAIANDSFKTKYELGNEYGMKEYGNAAKEWYEQVDAFVNVAKGKTISEVKALVVNADKGNKEVVNAGCTITINEFVLAIEEACNNAVDSQATTKDAVKLGIATRQTCKDADGDQNGQNEIETTMFAAAVDSNGKITAAYTDSVQVDFAFDANGASLIDITKAVLSKCEQKDNYGMKEYGNATKEWYEQAEVFSDACIGKTAGDITSLMGDDNYGNADIKNAGCTVLVDGFVKAASKIG